MIKAEDIMTKDVITVEPDTPISMVVKILAIRKITGVPVIDENRILLGLISEKDVMGLLLEDEHAEEKTALDFMTKDLHSFGPEDEVHKICEFLLTKPFRRVPIVREGKLLGIISRSDLISLLWKERWDNK
ncbi:MAG: CBS domain-containing protein [Candidatus Omnitrophica bacterium]|nr:CBS domain-containing protein [Candidatus Omnitrophota bacterium]